MSLNGRIQKRDFFMYIEGGEFFKRIRILIVFFLICVLPQKVISQESIGSNTISEKEDEKDWNFQAGPYYWFLGIKGTLNDPPSTEPVEKEPHEIDKSYNAIKHSLSFALALNIEYYQRRFTGIINLTAIHLRGDDITPDDLVLLQLFYKWTVIFAEVGGGYRILQNKKFNIDAFLGSKFYYSDITVDGHATRFYKIYRERSNLRITPILSARLTYIPFPKLELMTYMEYGIMGWGKERNNQFIFDAKYSITKWLYLTSGYRYWQITEENDNSLFSGHIYGPYIKTGIQF